MWSKGVFISDALVREKGHRVLQDLNSKTTTDKQISMTFSNGWIESFKKRNKFRCFKSHGEEGDADINAARAAVSHLRAIIDTYRPADVFDADEFGLAYKSAPTTTIAPSRLKGRKQNKDRITFLPCCNAAGTERLLLIVGRAAQPRCFGGLSGAGHSFDYEHAPKSWMNRAVFYRWLHRFDSYIGREEGRKALLLIDKASSHGTYEQLPTLQHVRILFLPKRTTSLLHPLDAGFIACIKRKYLHRKMERAVDLIES